MRKPVRIEISWVRMLEILYQQQLMEFSDISNEKELNAMMGWGRNCFSCDISCLNEEEKNRLSLEGFQDMYDGEILLIVQKETYPGKYLIGEF